MSALKTLFLSLLLLAPAALAQEFDDGDSKTSSPDEYITEAALPDHVAVTVKREIPGAYITQVVRQVLGDDTTRYRVEASQVGVFWIVVVRDDGELIEKYQSAGPGPVGADS